MVLRITASSHSQKENAGTREYVRIAEVPDDGREGATGGKGLRMSTNF